MLYTQAATRNGKSTASKTKVQNLLERFFFPLLEVNFIRHRNYTVVPFPIRLIEMWMEKSQNAIGVDSMSSND